MVPGKNCVIVPDFENYCYCHADASALQNGAENLSQSYPTALKIFITFVSVFERLSSTKCNYFLTYRLVVVKAYRINEVCDDS